MMDARALLQLERRVGRLETQVRRPLSTSAANAVLCAPGLVGAWVGGLDRNTPALIDFSGNGMHLTFAGDAHLSLDATLPYFPYLVFDGTGDYLARADEAKLDILGTEARIVAARRGLTFACWVRYNNTASANEIAGGKSNSTGNQRSWLLYRNSSGFATSGISNAGTATDAGAAGTTVMVAATWYHIAVVFKPSTYLRVFVNGVQEGEDATSVPASLFNSTADFRLGADGGAANPMTGRIGLPWLAAAALDEWVPYHYSLTRSLAGM